MGSAGYLAAEDRRPSSGFSADRSALSTWRTTIKPPDGRLFLYTTRIGPMSLFALNSFWRMTPTRRSLRQSPPAQTRLSGLCLEGELPTGRQCGEVGHLNIRPTTVCYGLSGNYGI